MAKSRNPRHGSMQFWPRVRASSETARIRAWSNADSGVLGFAGYKVGMTQIQYVDPQKQSLTKGQVVSEPVTIIECPPVSVIGVRVYTQSDDSRLVVSHQINASKLPLSVRKRLVVSKKEVKQVFDSLDVSKISDVRLLVATQPNLAGFGKKTSDIFELAIGGPVESQLTFAKEKLGQIISITDVFSPGDLVDSHSVSKGKGYQGSVKRFGVSLRQKKSEKTKRGPGSLGPWKGQGHIMYRIAMAGKMGYHLRTDYNKRIELISDDVTKVNVKSGFSHYGLVKTSYLLVRGSVSGPKKRLITLTKAIRPNNKYAIGEIGLDYISTESQN